MFTIQVIGDEHQVACGFCGRKEHITGPFVLGLQTPASVQETLEWHHKAPAVARQIFTSYQSCMETLAWESGPWQVLDEKGQVVEHGEFSMNTGRPVVDDRIQRGRGGDSWDVWRVGELAKSALADSGDPSRKMSVGATEGGVLVNLKKRNGRWEPVFISDIDLRVTKISDADISKAIADSLADLERDQRVAEQDGVSFSNTSEER